MSKIKSTVSDITVANNKEFLNTCNALKNALKKISQNNQKTATKITAVTTVEIAVLEKLIIAAHNLTKQESKLHAVAEHKSKTELKQPSNVQLLLNEKNVNIKNTALEKLHNEAEKKFAKSLDSYGSNYKKIDKLLQDIYDVINTFSQANKPVAGTPTKSAQIMLDDKTLANQEKTFRKFNDSVKKMFIKVNQLSYKNLENLEKAQLQIVEKITKKKQEILDKYNKSILAV